MTIFLHELKRSRLSILIWSAVIASMLAISIFVYPLLQQSMEELNQALMSMGDFASAFGVGELGFTDYVGYFSLECGEVLGIGGAIFAALCAISMLSKEENDHTAEFLLTHPVSRTKIAAEKLLAVYAQITLLNAVCWIITLVCTLLIGQHPSFKTMALILISLYLLQLEIASLSFGISAFLKGRGTGIGIGLALLFYFLNLIANITEGTKFLRWFTPFAYTNGSWIAEHQTLEYRYLIIGVLLSAAALIAGFLKYRKKDIAA
jgi:Putative exporter of polyketide antibiotics